MSDKLCMKVRPEQPPAVRTLTINRNTWWGIRGGFVNKTLSSTVTTGFGSASGCAVDGAGAGRGADRVDSVAC